MQIAEQVKVVVQKVQLCQRSLHRWHRERPERISLRHISDRSSETAETDLPLNLLTGQDLPFPQGQLLRSSLILRPLSLLLTLTRSAGPEYGLHLDVLLHPPSHSTSLLLLLLLLLRLKVDPLILDRRNRYPTTRRPISHSGSLCERLKVPSGKHVRVDGGHVDVTIIPVRRVGGDGLSVMRVLFWVQRTVGDWRRGHGVVSRRMVRKSADLVLLLLLLLLSSRGGDIPPLLRRTTIMTLLPRRTRRDRIPSSGRRRMTRPIHMYRNLARGTSLSRSSRLGSLGPRLARRRSWDRSVRVGARHLLLLR
jgi:hypothetical protein